MKIAILTSGILPVPAVQGGAVENLIDFYLDYNDMHQLHDITVYSVAHPDVWKHPALKSNVNHYQYINISSIWAKVKKLIYKRCHPREYHHYSIEYYLEKSLKLICKNNFDIIIIENRPAYALKVQYVTKAKLVFHLHNEKLSTSVPEFLPIYDSASRIITVSDYIASCVKTINPSDKKCVTVHNGIDLKAFSQDNSSLVDRASLSLSATDFVLIFSGRIIAEKGILQLIEAMLLLKQYTDIHLLVIGSSFYGNTSGEDSFILRLKEITDTIKSRIHFTGFIPYHQMPNYLSLADVAVIPSVWDDPFPTTVLEAQAMGLPVITTRRGGIPEEVSSKNAILLDTDDHFVDNLANAILDLYQHPEKQKAMSKASLERSKLFDKETYARNFFKAIEGV